MTSLGTTLLIRARIKSPATLALECDAAHPHHHPQTQTPVSASRSFVMHVPVHSLPWGKDGQRRAGRVGLEMRPARLRRNQGRLTSRTLLSWVVFFLLSCHRPAARLHYTQLAHTYAPHAHTCLICAGRAANRATSSANKPPLRPSQWMVSQPREPEHARKREEHPHQSTDYLLRTRMSDLLSRKSLRYQR